MIVETFNLRQGREYVKLTVYAQEQSPEIPLSKLRPMVVVCPGGAYVYTSDREAEPIALHFLNSGFNAAVVRYSVGNDAAYPDPLVDVSKAIKIIRENHEKYCIDPDNTNQLKATDETNLIFGEMVEVTNPYGTVSKVRGEITADNISVNSALLTDKGCWNIACAYSTDPNYLDENSAAVGNSQNAVAMLGTRTEKLSGLGNMSVEDYYTNLLGKIAAGGSN